MTRCPYFSGVVTGCPYFSGVVTGCPYFSGVVTGCPYFSGVVTGCPYFSGVVTGCPYFSGVMVRSVHILRPRDILIEMVPLPYPQTVIMNQILEVMSPYKMTKYRMHRMSCDRKYRIILWFAPAHRCLRG